MKKTILAMMLIATVASATAKGGVNPLYSKEYETESRSHKVTKFCIDGYEFLKYKSALVQVYIKGTKETNFIPQPATCRNGK